MKPTSQKWCLTKSRPKAQTKTRRNRKWVNTTRSRRRRGGPYLTPPSRELLKSPRSLLAAQNRSLRPKVAAIGRKWVWLRILAVSRWIQSLKQLSSCSRDRSRWAIWARKAWLERREKRVGQRQQHLQSGRVWSHSCAPTLQVYDSEHSDESTRIRHISSTLRRPTACSGWQSKRHRSAGTTNKFSRSKSFRLLIGGPSARVDMLLLIAGKGLCWCLAARNVRIIPALRPECNPDLGLWICGIVSIIFRLYRSSACYTRLQSHDSLWENQSKTPQMTWFYSLPELV